jgi:hypothetical protein
MTPEQVADELYGLVSQIAMVAASIPSDGWTVESARDTVTRIGGLEEELSRIKKLAWDAKAGALRARSQGLS